MKTILAVNPHWVKHMFLPHYDSVIEDGGQVSRAIPFKCEDCDPGPHDYKNTEIEFLVICPFCSHPCTNFDEGDLQCNYGSHSSFYCLHCGAEGILEENLTYCHQIVTKPSILVPVSLDTDSSVYLDDLLDFSENMLTPVAETEVTKEQKQFIDEFLQKGSDFPGYYYSPKTSKEFDFYQINLFFIEKVIDGNSSFLDTYDRKSFASQEEIMNAIAMLSGGGSKEKVPEPFILLDNDDKDHEDDEISRILRVGVDVQSYDLRNPLIPYSEGVDISHGGFNIELLCRANNGSHVHVRLSGD